MNIYEKLTAIQSELVCTKAQYNSFGKYHYRSCEDILTAVKPLTKEHNVTLSLADEVKLIGERFYICATAKLVDSEKPDDFIEVTAYAREEETKKGMDGSQVTGTASSYARKYALNGLFSIDDTKDADTDEHAKLTGKAEKKSSSSKNSVDTSSKLVCPKCGKPIEATFIKTKSCPDGKEYVPAAVFSRYGSCYECYKKSKETKE